MQCKICSSPSFILGEDTVLKRYRVRYYRCSSCGFTQTEEPYWLKEAYSSAISGSDVGLVSRNFSHSIVTKSIIDSFFDRGGKFLDYAGGYGILVRLMRDAGYDFYWTDEFCPNLFAKGFEASLNPEMNRYEMVTAFEVLEHLVDPMVGVERMLGFSRNLLFSTELLPPDTPEPGTWWYYAPEHGQHVSFYTLNSLVLIARHFGLNCVSDGRSIHLFTERKIPSFLFKLITIRPFAICLNKFRRRPSLLQSDFQKAVNALREHENRDF